MGLYTELPETIHEVDVIIAGGMSSAWSNPFPEGHV
jgi:hypothetical protein